MPVLQIIVASTRPGRVGIHVANWFIERAREHGGFEVEIADLAELALPMFDEPHHPRLGKYEHDHTKAWSEQVRRADAFVIVMPEYNTGPTPALLNAIAYLSKEWAYKPAAFVSYGGISGGLRAVQAVKPVLGILRVVPIVEAVTIPFVGKQIDEQTGVFTPNDVQAKAATALLDELVRWAHALLPLRK
ncbi:MAG: NADPH-dependent FMN reductase [Vicinamibacterales bacterium]